MLDKIDPPPGDLSPEPDASTSKSPDHTSNNAEGRVFFMNLCFMKYGTDDRVNGSAMFLSILLLIIIFVLIGVGIFYPESTWLERMFTWVGGAFFLVCGVAIGRNADNLTRNSD
jgi:hypothetical protein